MAKRRIAVIEGKTTVHIRYDSEWREYTVRIVGIPEADYYTDDRVDAFATAHLIAAKGR